MISNNICLASNLPDITTNGITQQEIHLSVFYIYIDMYHKQILNKKLILSLRSFLTLNDNLRINDSELHK